LKKNAYEVAYIPLAPDLLSRYPYKGIDRDHPPNDHTNIRGGGGDSKEAEEVQDLARDKLKQFNNALETSPGN